MSNTRPFSLCISMEIQRKLNSLICKIKEYSDLTDYYHKSQYTNRNSYKTPV